MNFRKYMHIERLDTDEVEGITNNICYVFPKIDGTNSSIWLGDDGKIKAGSRNRELTEEEDNQGFYSEYVKQNKKLKKLFAAYPYIRLYGEWLVPHTLKTYRKEAWRDFYIFDVTATHQITKNPEKEIYLNYEYYKPIVLEFDLNIIPPLKIVENPTKEHLLKLLKANTFLIKDGEEPGEGIVIKNYEFENKYGRQCWAKIVRNEFKSNAHRTKGPPTTKIKKNIEQKIVAKYCTPNLIEKEYAKIKNRENGWRSERIPELFGRVYHTLINEELWNAIKKLKNPVINFSILKTIVVSKIKKVKSELF